MRESIKQNVVVNKLTTISLLVVVIVIHVDASASCADVSLALFLFSLFFFSSTVQPTRSTRLPPLLPLFISLFLPFCLVPVRELIYILYTLWSVLPLLSFPVRG